MAFNRTCIYSRPKKPSYLGTRSALVSRNQMIWKHMNVHNHHHSCLQIIWDALIALIISLAGEYIYIYIYIMGKLQYFTNLNSSAIWGWFPWNKPWFQGSVATWGRCDLPCIHQTTELANQGLCVLQFCILGFLPLTMNLGPGYHLAMCSGTHWQTCRGFLSHDGTPNHEKKVLKLKPMVTWGSPI